MKKVIASEFLSLDGVIENPVWTFQFTGDEQQRFKSDELSAANALLARTGDPFGEPQRRFEACLREEKIELCLL